MTKQQLIESLDLIGKLLKQMELEEIVKITVLDSNVNRLANLLSKDNGSKNHTELKSLNVKA